MTPGAVMFAFLITLHVLSAVIWVGGMFFAYVALRPAAVNVLDAPTRVRLWEATFNRFFPWVWLAVAILLGSGFWMMFIAFNGMKAPIYIQAMLGIALVMMAIYAHIFFAPFKLMRRAIKAGDTPAAGHRLKQIRQLIGVNLILGLIVVIIAVSGSALLGS